MARSGSRSQAPRTKSTSKCRYWRGVETSRHVKQGWLRGVLAAASLEDRHVAFQAGRPHPRTRVGNEGWRQVNAHAGTSPAGRGPNQELSLTATDVENPRILGQSQEANDLVELALTQRVADNMMLVAD